jgi:hypothetical protein
MQSSGRSIAQVFSRRDSTAEAQVGLCGICDEQSGIGAGFSEYFGFPCQFSFHQMLHIYISSGAGTIDQLVVDVPSGLSLIPPQTGLQWSHDVRLNEAGGVPLGLPLWLSSELSWEGRKDRNTAAKESWLSNIIEGQGLNQAVVPSKERRRGERRKMKTNVRRGEKE